jgi:hypothetical protein
MDFLELITSLGLTIDKVKDQEALVAHFQAINDNQLPEGTDLAVMQEGIDELAALKVVDPELTPETLTTLQANQLGTDDKLITEDQAATLAAVDGAGDVTTLVAEGKMGKTYLDNIRTNAVAQFKIAEGDSANEEIVNTIMKADLQAAKAFEAQYAGLVETKFPLTCKNCDSTDISRQTSNQGKPAEQTNSYAAKRDKFAANSRRTPSSMHEVPAK